MRFCEKLKDARTKAGMKQEELAKALGVSLRTITNYESGECYPRKRDIYHKLAELFHTEENYFLNEDEEFLLSAAEKYGAKGAKQAQALVDEVSGLFAGGNIADEDLDVMMKVHAQEISQGLIFSCPVNWTRLMLEWRCQNRQRGVFALGYSDFGDRADSKQTGRYVRHEGPAQNRPSAWN